MFQMIFPTMPLTEEMMRTIVREKGLSDVWDAVVGAGY